MTASTTKHTVLVLSVSQRESLGFFKWITTIFFIVRKKKTKQKKITFYKELGPKCLMGLTLHITREPVSGLPDMKAFRVASKDMISNGCSSKIFAL